MTLMAVIAIHGTKLKTPDGCMAIGFDNPASARMVETGL
jgi:hypothetical protein